MDNYKRYNLCFSRKKTCPSPVQNGSPIKEKNFVTCFDIGKVPRSPGKWNWNQVSFFAIHFHFWTMCLASQAKLKGKQNFPLTYLLHLGHFFISCFLDSVIIPSWVGVIYLILRQIPFWNNIFLIYFHDIFHLGIFIVF